MSIKNRLKNCEMIFRWFLDGFFDGARANRLIKQY